MRYLKFYFKIREKYKDTARCSVQHCMVAQALEVRQGKKDTNIGEKIKNSIIICR